MWLNEATEPGLQPHESTRLCVFSKPPKSRRATAAPILRQKLVLNISICKCYSAKFIVNCAGSWTHMISSPNSCTSSMKSFDLNNFQAGQNVPMAAVLKELQYVLIRRRARTGAKGFSLFPTGFGQFS